MCCLSQGGFEVGSGDLEIEQRRSEQWTLLAPNLSDHGCTKWDGPPYGSHALRAGLIQQRQRGFHTTERHRGWEKRVGGMWALPGTPALSHCATGPNEPP